MEGFGLHELQIAYRWQVEPHGTLRTMQRLFTVSYPEISSEAAALIDAFRERHDPKRRTVVDAHVTMVFGCAAMLGADDEHDIAYIFLVPDQGYAEVSLLHDRLYTGILQPYLRLDLPYIPHITIGTLKNRTEAKALCDELNRQGLCIEGRLATLAVGRIETGKFSNLSVHALGEASLNPSSRPG